MEQNYTGSDVLEAKALASTAERVFILRAAPPRDSLTQPVAPAGSWRAEPTMQAAPRPREASIHPTRARRTAACPPEIPPATRRASRQRFPAEPATPLL